MPGILDQFFDPVKNANDSGAGNHFVPGLFRVKCTGLEFAESQRKDGKMWFRAQWEILDFKGCKHKKYTPEGVTDDSSVGTYEPGQRVSTTLNIASDTFQGAAKSIWISLLSGLAGTEDMSIEQLTDFSKEDIDQLVNHGKGVGIVLLTECLNSGMKRNPATGLPTADFTKHTQWIAESRYTGRKWWSADDSDAGI